MSYLFFCFLDCQYPRDPSQPLSKKQNIAFGFKAIFFSCGIAWVPYFSCNDFQTWIGPHHARGLKKTLHFRLQCVFWEMWLWSCFGFLFCRGVVVCCVSPLFLWQHYLGLRPSLSRHKVASLTKLGTISWPLLLDDDGALKPQKNIQTLLVKICVFCFTWKLVQLHIQQYLWHMTWIHWIALEYKQSLFKKSHNLQFSNDNLSFMLIVASETSKDCWYQDLEPKWMSCN